MFMEHFGSSITKNKRSGPIVRELSRGRNGETNNEIHK